MTDQQSAKGPASYEIRRLEEQDISSVAAFEAEIAKISFPEDPITDPDFHAKRLRRSIGQDGAFVAVDAADGAVKGWALVTSRENFNSKERYADFKSLYITPDRRGGRLVFQLMSAIEDFAARNQLSKITGRTSAVNAGMQAVYKLCGYDAVHVVYERALPTRQDTPVNRDGSSSRRARHARPTPAPGETYLRRKPGTRRP